MRIVAIRPAFVADKWRDKYQCWAVDHPLNDGRTWPEVEAAIRALPSNTTTAEINTVIGNHSWTPMQCAECGEEIQRGVHLGYEEDCRYPGTGSYRRWGAVLCGHCLGAAVKALESGENEVPL